MLLREICLRFVLLLFFSQTSSFLSPLFFLSRTSRSPAEKKLFLWFFSLVFLRSFFSDINSPFLPGSVGSPAARRQSHDRQLLCATSQANQVSQTSEKLLWEYNLKLKHLQPKWNIKMSKVATVTMRAAASQSNLRENFTQKHFHVEECFENCSTTKWHWI